MINANTIKPDMPVVCSLDGQFAEVDHMEGSDSIKLKRDKLVNITTFHLAGLFLPTMAK